MLKTIKNVIVVLMVINIFSLVVGAENNIKLVDLVEKGKKLDKKEISVSGEAVGDKMKRGSYSWININDGTNSMGVWMDNKEADRVKNLGNYQHKGDKIQITGSFNRACAVHGGDMDIHAQSLRVIEKGHKVNSNIHTKKIVTGAVLTLITALLGAWHLGKNRK